MIYNYEREILRFINRCIPEIKLMTYASDEDLLTGLASVKEFPSMFYSRKDMNITYNKTIEVPPSKESPFVYHLYPYEQAYQGTILVENQEAAFRVIRSLKYYWNSHPFINVLIPGISELCLDRKGNPTPTRVSLKLIGIGVEDVRLANDKNGACRAVRFSWTSNLLLSNIPKAPTSLVQVVEIDVHESRNEDEAFVIELTK